MRRFMFGYDAEGTLIDKLPLSRKRRYNRAVKRQARVWLTKRGATKFHTETVFF